MPVQISEEAEESVRGLKLTAQFEVLEVKKLEIPELTPELLQELGGFDSEGAFRDALHDDLNRQLTYHQEQQARKQITALLTAAATWELPPELLRRQSRREMERTKLELRRSGFGDEEIQQKENEIRQNVLANTARLLKEHFILERIAEDEKIADEPADYDQEIELIAAQSGESVRRVRAHLEQRDLMDVLRNQIIERKVIELVLKHATFQDVPFKPEGADVEAWIGRPAANRTMRKRKFPKPSMEARSNRSPERNRGDRIAADGARRPIEPPRLLSRSLQGMG